MIDYIRGKIADKELTHISIETAGVGYSVSIPLSTYEKLPEPGKDALVYIHYYVREDDVKLYGFASKDDREIFRNLITVNSVGPKVAMSIMSGISLENLVMYVNAGDTAGLKKVPGVGLKTAERIIIELKGKLGPYSSTSTPRSKIPIAKGRKEEAYAAMLSLGYNDKQVAKAIDRVSLEIDREAQIEEWIRMALKII
ncbi:ATP-dependent DNA helicase RuvA [Fibrobacteres bacterium R8-0-B4]